MFCLNTVRVFGGPENRRQESRYLHHALRDVYNCVLSIYGIREGKHNRIVHGKWTGLQLCTTKSAGLFYKSNRTRNYHCTTQKRRAKFVV